MFYQAEYANPDSISAHQMGALTMLAHFHYVNKGKQPFALVLDRSGLQEVAEFGKLNAEQVEFVRASASLVHSRGTYYLTFWIRVY